MTTKKTEIEIPGTLGERLSRAGVTELPLKLPLAPDASRHNPSPLYLRSLLAEAGITQEAAAKAIGITGRAMRNYLADVTSKSYRPAPYATQYALEMLAVCTGEPRAKLRDQGDAQ